MPVSLGEGMPDAVLFVYSSQENLDPWHEIFNFPKDTLKMALYTMDGIIMWKRDLGNGVIPGIWFTPFISFDLDQDGVDEIWFVNNLNPDAPFSFNARVLERIDPLTGKTTGQWKWPNNTVKDTMSHSYRFFISGGYVHDEPVLVTAQGTYGDMYLQGYNKGVEKRWDIKIPYDDMGARSSHLCPVLDFNNDGVDELFWGERLISLDDGHEVFCADKGRYLGHSDIVVPFEDFKTGRRYIYTCREGYERPGEPRVVTYNERGEREWIAIESVGHMHNGWIANIPPDYHKVAMAMRITRRVIDNKIVETEPEDFYFDAITGFPLESVFPFKGYEFMPIDFDGDGYHEFYGTRGNRKGFVVDWKGKVHAFVGGSVVRSGKVMRRPGEQLMVFYHDEGKVRIWGDVDAVESEYTKKRFSHSYHWRMQHFMGTGYNHMSSHITCGM
ncbi:MAG TPA: hypothetical protein GXX37_01560 [Clostridiaceae bacterium]|nr:hypothetical protein [Clostridiaceae bacterium]